MFRYLIVTPADAPRCFNAAMNTLRKTAATLVALGAALLVSSCNSTLDDGTTTTSTQSATGYWTGTDSVSGLNITALINSGGQATFIRADGVQFTGVVQVSGSTLAVTVDGYTQFPNTFPDGSVYGIGTLSGTVTSSSSISATLSFTTNGNTAISGTWSLTYQTVSTNASSLAAISNSGPYTDTVTGAVLAITSAGDMTESATNNCVLNGSVSTTDATYDIYQVAFSYGNCTGTYAVLNGVQFTGLATLNTGVSPAQLIIAVVGTSTANVQYGIVSTLNN
jgi:hypothetical protein